MSKNSTATHRARPEAEGVRPDPETELIPLSEAAAMLGLGRDKLRYYYTAGTEDMVRIRQGKRIFLLRAEVERHLANPVEPPPRPRQRPGQYLRELFDYRPLTKEEIRQAIAHLKIKE